MKKNEDLYVVKLRCKRYVQHYLLVNYGCRMQGHPCLVDIRKDDELKEFLYRAIKRPVVTRDKWLSSFEGKKRNCEVELRISSDIFNRFGWELSTTDEVHLNSILEARCKKQLLDYLKLQYALHEDLHDAIFSFYRMYGYSNRSWPFNSIVKIWSRSKAKLDVFSFKDEFNQLFTKIFMDKLSTQEDNLQQSLTACIS